MLIKTMMKQTLIHQLTNKIKREKKLSRTKTKRNNNSQKKNNRRMKDSNCFEYINFHFFRTSYNSPQNLTQN